MKALLCENRTAIPRFLTESNGLITVNRGLLNMVFFLFTQGKGRYFFYICIIST